MCKLLCSSTEWRGMAARMGFQLGHYKDKELASTMTTVNRFLRYLDSPTIADSTSDSSFDPTDLVKKKMTMYLILPPDHARAQMPLLRMWISMMLRAVVRGGLQEDMEGRAPDTVREWCRLGQLRAEKTGTQSGPHARWTISHAEYLRFQREGLLPIQRHFG